MYSMGVYLYHKNHLNLQYVCLTLTCSAATAVCLERLGGMAKVYDMIHQGLAWQERMCMGPWVGI